ncbi:MAG: 50S ribosomal protein L35 [Alphaproteobacteria bacterium]|nr:50S ribosomal protein L35 [Alphaproteobacteria bacterium]
MSKLKSHSGTKKRFSMTASGKIKRSFAFKRHNLRKRSQDMKRASRGCTLMNERDAKIIKKFLIPYGLN